MLKNKKSQGMSIRTIIIAVIGLIVLVVVVGLLTGKFEVFKSGVNEVFTTNTDEIRCCDICDFENIECYTPCGDIGCYNDCRDDLSSCETSCGGCS